MRLPHLVLRELRHRWPGFLLATAMAALSTAAVLWIHRTLVDHRERAAQAASELQAATATEVAALDNQIRKQMKGLGFNIHILPEGQALADVYDKGFASKTMPESHVTTLANSKIVTINHLLPRLIRKVEWTERKRQVIAIGIRGEVPFAHKDPKKPLLDPVAPGTLVLGHELHRSLELKPGDQTSFRGKSFDITACHPERGNADDITIWMNLGEAQRMFELPGQINEILALECNCASLDRLGEVRREIGTILPGTQIIEKESQALARAEARNVVAANGKRRLAALETAHAAQLAERTRVASQLLPLVALLALAGIGALSWVNVRARRPEIAMLRAMGLGTGSVLGVVLARAGLAGLLGGALGVLIAFGGRLAPWTWPLLALLAAVMALVAAWLPALLASRSDPADVLRDA